MLRIKIEHIKDTIWFKIILNNLSEYYSEIHPNTIFYMYDEYLLFSYDKTKNGFECDFDNIWSIFINYHNMIDDDIYKFIKSNIEKELNLKNSNPYKGYISNINNILNLIKI